MPVDEIAIPSDILSTIQTLSKEWKSRNSSVPCAIYEKKEAAIVDRIVARIHGKGQQEGRLDWNSVGTARHNRQELSRSEPALDLLESYLINGKNVTPEQQERWAAVFPLTVLHEAMPTIASRLGLSSGKKNYRQNIRQSNIDQPLRILFTILDRRYFDLRKFEAQRKSLQTTTEFQSRKRRIRLVLKILQVPHRRLEVEPEIRI